MSQARCSGRSTSGPSGNAFRKEAHGCIHQAHLLSAHRLPGLCWMQGLHDSLVLRDLRLPENTGVNRSQTRDKGGGAY